MKKKLPLKVIIFVIIIAIPLYIQAFSAGSESPILTKIFAPPFAIFACFLGSGIIALGLALAMHFATKFYFWLFDEEDKRPETKNEYDDLGPFMVGLFPILFVVAYYAMYTKAI